MPRGPRLVLPNVGMHVVQRGINRQPCFFSDGDYAGYLGLLKSFAAKHGCSIHAYCLMTNHVHLLLTPRQRGACAKVMKEVNQRYVQRLNFQTGRSGTLWEGRFHSSLVVTDAYALCCYRYIELNPVRAGMVSQPGDYTWSSYHANAGAAGDPLVCAHDAYLSLGSTESARIRAYRGLLDVQLPQDDVEAIRKATSGGYRIGESRRPRGRPPRNRATS